jgi:folate-binding Fe-S cluster repair protein YgfZ
MHRRGTLKTRLLPLAFDGPPPPPGAEVLAGALRAGEVLSGVEGRALALLRLDRMGGDLAVDGVKVRVDPPTWFPTPTVTRSVDSG